MNRGWVVGMLVMAVTGGAFASAATDAAAGKLRDCGRIGFEPNTDNVATNIKVRATSCRRGRRVVRRVTAGDLAPFGFSCRSRDGGTALPSRVWLCRKRNATVRWRKF